MKKHLLFALCLLQPLGAAVASYTINGSYKFTTQGKKGRCKFYSTIQKDNPITIEQITYMGDDADGQKVNLSLKKQDPMMHRQAVTLLAMPQNEGQKASLGGGTTDQGEKFSIYYHLAP